MINLLANRTPTGWHSSPLHTDHASELIELTFCIRLDGVDKLESALWSVSDPASPSYGHHWSIDRIAEVTGTRPRAKAVAAWVRERSSRVDVAVGGDYVRAWVAPGWESVGAVMCAVRSLRYRGNSYHTKLKHVVTKG